jgi:hypothetical protein
MKPKKNVTKARASEYEIYAAFLFSAVTISKFQQIEPINGHALGCG